MKFLILSILIFSAHVSGQNNSPEECTLGIFTADSQAQAAAKSTAEVLFPSYIAANPQICPENSNTKRNHGLSPFGGLTINPGGNIAHGYTPGANINVVLGCWVCPVYCNVGWSSYKACVLNTCPNGHALVDGRCIQYSLAVPEDAPPSICEEVAGNPISVIRGTKHQKEIDIVSVKNSLVAFHRTYSNSNPQHLGSWHNTYKKALRFVKHNRLDFLRAKSSAYASKEAACSEGFNEIKNQLMDEWTQQTTSQFSNGVCQIVRDNKVVKNIAIVPHGKKYEEFHLPGSIQLIRADGSILNFGLTANNEYQSLSGEHGKLLPVDSAAPIIWRFVTSTGDIEDYNAEGRLLSITASNGMKQELFYDATSGLLSRVKDSTNRELLFTYTGNQISGVTADGNKTTSYAYNALGLISQVTRPDNKTRLYHYEDTRFPTYLTGITDERGKRYATWTYDAQGRAISSEHAGGAEKTLLAFNADGSTTVTNALNKQTIYRFDDIAGARRVTKVEGQPTANCAGANQDYTYTPEGWIASKTDWKGIRTTFTYNTAGQEISRTQAFGTTEARTTTTEWHPTLFVKTKVTEPEKAIIYSYDTTGRLLSQTVNAP